MYSYALGHWVPRFVNKVFLSQPSKKMQDGWTYVSQGVTLASVFQQADDRERYLWHLCFPNDFFMLGSCPSAKAAKTMAETALFIAGFVNPVAELSSKTDPRLRITFDARTGHHIQHVGSRDFNVVWAAYDDHADQMTVNYTTVWPREDTEALRAWFARFDPQDLPG